MKYTTRTLFLKADQAPLKVEGWYYTCDCPKIKEKENGPYVGPFDQKNLAVKVARLHRTAEGNHNR